MFFSSFNQQLQKSILHNFIFILSLFFFALFFSCKQKTNITLEEIENAFPESDILQNQKDLVTRKSAQSVQMYIKYVELQKEKAVSDFIDNLSIEDKLAQLFIMNISGNSECPSIQKPVPGMYLFFNYNVADTPDKVIGYTNSIQTYFKSNNFIPPFLMIDHEGGLVNRLRSIASPLPSAALIPQRMTSEQAQEYYYYQGLQLKALGFDINLAPIVEVELDENRDFLGTRSYGNFDNTVNYATMAVLGYKKAGINCVIKHFPGNTNDDPHKGLPTIQAEITSLTENYFKPFENVLTVNPSGVLLSHAVVTAIDPNIPSCFSKTMVQEILKNQYAFQGLVYSDDIYMAALADNGFPPDVAAIKAIEAGVNVIMISQKSFGSLITSLIKEFDSNTLFHDNVLSSVSKIIFSKLESGILVISDNNNGTYSIENSYDSDLSVDKKLALFNDAYQNGEALYYKYFTKGN